MAIAQDALTQKGIASLSFTLPEATSARKITPIVFWASFVPCASDMREAVPTCPHRKPRVFLSSETGEAIRYTNHVPTVETSAATRGDITAGITILESTPPHCTPENPRAASAEPISPPNSACEELDGKPNSQVSTFQRIPPTSPVNTMSISAEPSFLMSI